MKRFDIYARVREARQAAGDVHDKLLTKKGWNNAETIEWGRVEELLNDVEMKLEKLDLMEAKTDAKD